MAITNPGWTDEADELFDLEHLASNRVDEETGMILGHPAVYRQLLSVDEKLYQPVDTLEATAYENLSLAEVLDDTDSGVDRWDY